MELHKIAASIVKAVSTEKCRPALNRVHLTDNYAEACDGHILARVYLPHGQVTESTPVSALVDPKSIVAAAKVAKPFIPGALLDMSNNGTYPNCDQVTPEKKDDGFVIGFAPEALGRACAIAKAAGCRSMRLQMPAKPLDAMRVDGVTSEGTELVMVVMPYRL